MITYTQRVDAAGLCRLVAIAVTARDLDTPILFVFCCMADIAMS